MAAVLFIAFLLSERPSFPDHQCQCGAGESAVADNLLLPEHTAEILHIYCLFKLAVVRRGREIVKLLIYEKTPFTEDVRMGLRCREQNQSRHVG